MYRKVRMKKIFYTISYILVLILPLEVYSQNSESGIKQDSISLSYTIDSIIALGKTFIGKPYKYVGPSKWPMDCSGYLAYIFSVYGYSLSHSSSGMIKNTNSIKLEDVQKGDLLFFTGRNKYSGTIGHVTLVIEVTTDKIMMMHSCSRGVLIDEYQKMTYYTERLISAGRPTFFDNRSK